MKVMDLTKREPAVCRPEDSLERAAQVMWEHDCGCVPIVDGDRRPVGMITDRDVSMAAYLRGQPLREVRIGEVIAREVRCCRAEDPLDVAHQLMREHQVRRLPVVDDDGLLVGVVSLADLVRSASLEDAADKRRQVADEMLATYLAVSRPRLERPDVLVPKPAVPRGGASAGAPRSARTKGAKKG